MKQPNTNGVPGLSLTLTEEKIPAGTQLDKLVSATNASPLGTDVFRLAREAYTVAGVWRALGLEGGPKASCRSPFREESNPSFSIFNDGRAWKDHGSGDGGDVIEFVKTALGGDYAEVRNWFAERIGIDVLDGRGEAEPQRSAERPHPRRKMQFPAPLLEGSAATWDGFARKRRLPYPAVFAAVKAGVLRFTKPNGLRCFCVTDDERRSAEIRRIDGGTFSNGAKAFPLVGVDKRWPTGTELLRGCPRSTGVLVCEGASDLLAALGLYSSYWRNLDDPRSWVPVAVLGASCRKLCPEAAHLIRERRVRLCFDGDEPGRTAAEHWGDTLAALGCDVDRVTMPDRKDLRDVAENIEPGALFA